MIIAYVFSVTIQQPQNVVAFLKAFPKIPLIEGKIPQLNKINVIEKNDRVETLSLLGKVEACCYSCFRSKLKAYSKREKLSCEYCWGKNVYLLPYNQLSSQEVREKKIEHKEIRKKKFKHQDLKLHPITCKDLGDVIEKPICLTLKSYQWQCQLKKNQKELGEIKGLIKTLNQIDFWEKDSYFYNIIEKEKNRVKTIGQGKEKVGLWSTIPDQEINLILEELKEKN